MKGDFILQVIQTFGAFRLTLFPLWPGLVASFPSCLGRSVPVRLQIRPDLITVANQNVLSHILFEGWTENSMPWYSASCAVSFWMDLTKGLASRADDLRALSCVSVPHTSAEMSGYKHKPITTHSLLRCNLFVDK